MTEPTHHEIQALLGAHALDSTEGEERAAVERHLEGCARCRAEVQDHREVASMLAHGGATAPAGVWEKIAGALESAPPALALVTSSQAARQAGASARPARRPWAARLAVAVIAVAAGLIGVLGVQLERQDDRIDRLSALLATDGVSRSFQSALAEPDARLVQLASADGGLKVKAVVTKAGEGYLSASPLPALPGDRTYQLWGDVGDRRVSLGPMGPDPSVTAFRTFEAVKGLAITDEAAPGVVVSAAPALAYGILPR